MEAASGALLARAKVDEAARLVRSRPADVPAVAQEAIRLARRAGDPRLQVEARLARATAALHQNRVRDAVTDLRAAERLSRLRGLDDLLFRVVITWIPVMAERGEFSRAHRLIAAAESTAGAPERAALRFNQGYLLQGQGRLGEALAVYEEALDALRAVGDTTRQARLLNNRAVIHTQRGMLDDALADLRAAERLYAELGEERLTMDVWANLGWALAFRGDLTESLRWFDRVDAFLRERGEEDPLALRDRVDALLTARLLAEARSSAERAEAEFVRRGVSHRAAEIRLVLSQIALLDGDQEAAEGYAVRAGRAFRRQHQPALAALADLAGVRVRVARDAPSSALLTRCRRVAAELAAAGWRLPALEARLVGAQLAVALGRPDVARAELATVTRASGRDPVLVRARVLHARALLCVADGELRRAESFLRRAVRLLDEYRSSLGATELRTLASMHAEDISVLGIDLALAQGQASQVLAWAERARGNALWLRPVPLARDPQALADLAALREAAAQADTAVLAGQDARPLLAKQASLELQIRRRSLVAGADSASRGHGPAGDLRGLADVLGNRILLEIVQHRGRLIALTLDGAAAGRRSQQQMRDLGDTASVLADVSGLRFSLRRLSRRHGTAASLAAAGGQATAAAARLAAALLGALPGDPRPLVLIPTGALHAVPWHRLPGWESRPVTVAPSAELWLRGERQRRSAGSSAGTGVVLACGPGLPGADHEVAALSELYGSATVLQGADATVGRVLAAMESSSLAHVAAHGVVRADNPQFSSLRLVDGPLTVYDLEGMPKVPGCLVLSACDAGLSDVKPGDELRGFVAALLALGASSVVASVVPVPDLAARPLMLAFHRGLVDGLSPAEALALAQIDPSVDRDSGVAAGFVCFGSG